ncbi:3-keto-5-aminohexanoate cleavage protein [uncultured Cohaesibacter sp.]|uniref:3-keto-5-aminohexanoate cleavage protein n=1 Tax=uncultured Cohaesibacter sp. TaxID=1002546 RepID=UPI00292F3D2D|nr:3-keto-5-aminohexanoate cleavage protein [uncultured Cohaesibacter sp.]
MFEIPKPLVVALSANGLKRSKRDYLALPLSQAELVTTALQAREVGVPVFSCSARNPSGQASLDTDICRSLVDALRQVSSGAMLVQLELDLQSPQSVADSAAVLSAAKPDACLLPFSAVFPRDGDEDDENRARDLLDLCVDLKIGVQFAMTDPADIDWYYAFRQYGVIPEMCRALLFILGDDGDRPQSDPHALRPFLERLDKQHLLSKVVWSVAAFGLKETASLAAAMALGGQIAPGWAYNFHTAEGEMFPSQAEQAASLKDLSDRLGRPLASAFEARTMLFGAR